MTRFISLTQALPPHPTPFSFPPGFCLYSFPLSSLQSRSPSSTLLHIFIPPPFFLWRRGRGSARLLSCVLPPGRLSNYCMHSFKQRKKMAEKWGKRGTRRLQPLVALSKGFTAVLQLMFCSKNLSFHLLTEFKESLCRNISSSICHAVAISLCVTLSPLWSLVVHLFSSQHSWWKLFSYSVCHLLPFFFFCDRWLLMPHQWKSLNKKTNLQGLLSQETNCTISHTISLQPALSSFLF